MTDFKNIRVCSVVAQTEQTQSGLKKKSKPFTQALTYKNSDKIYTKILILKYI